MTEDGTIQERGETTSEPADATADFEGSEEHDVLMGNLSVRYYTSLMGVADCTARMGTFCSNFLMVDMQVSSDMSDELRGEIERELAWFQDQWEKRWTRIGERIQKEHRLPELPRPAMSITKDGVFFMLGTGRGPL